LLGAVGRLFEDLEHIKKLYLRIGDLEDKVVSYSRFIAANRPVRVQRYLGISPLIHEAKELAMRIAKTDSTVLLTGESGTGKELFAHSIHQSAIVQKDPYSGKLRQYTLI